MQLHSQEEKEENEEVIRICLTFLTMVLYDLRKKEDVKWDVFTSLLPSLQKLKTSSLPFIPLLAKEVNFAPVYQRGYGNICIFIVNSHVQVYNLILTRNVAGKSSPGDNASGGPLIEEISKSAYEKAMDDACDPLIPSRAHALMELITLIKTGDAETLAKKEKLLCLFQVCSLVTVGRSGKVREFPVTVLKKNHIKVNIDVRLLLFRKT